MGLLYAAGFQVGGVNTMTLSTLGTGATVAAGYYMPGAYGTADIEPFGGATYGGLAYTGFAQAVKSAFDAATGTVFTVSLSDSTGKYTISRATTFSMTFSTAADLRLMAALGFTANKSGANTYTSDIVAGYCMITAVDGRTNVVGNMEEDVGEESVSDGGQAFVITKRTNERMMSWSQSMEPRSRVYQFATSTSTWGWDTWFTSTRGAHPFYINDVLDGEPTGSWYQLTARGAAFRPQRVTADYDDQWIIPFETRMLGRAVP